MSEAVEDVEGSLDGLDNSQNSAIMLLASAAAIPMSLWKQAAVAVRGLTTKEYGAADECLTAAARHAHPHEQLALQVAEQLAPRLSQSVALVEGISSADTRDQPALVECSAPRPSPAPQRTRTAINPKRCAASLDIRVLSLALTGKDGINPPLALCVEAQATLLRNRDGQCVYSVPVHYRSQRRRFTQWAAQDARLFRQELDQCYRQLSQAIADELLSRNFLAPEQILPDTFATK